MSQSDHLSAEGNGVPRPAVRSTNVARFSLSAEAVALSGLFDRDSGLSVEVEPAVASPADLALLVIRPDDVDRETVDDALRADPAVERIDRLGGGDRAWEYGVRWGDPVRRLVDDVVAEGAVVSSAAARDGRWYVRVTATDRSALLAVQDLLRGVDPTVECLSVTTLDGGERSARDVLTEKQRRAVVAAYEAGYYDVPRRTTTEEVADELGVSHQALSERFRRAHAKLVCAALPVEDQSA